MSLQDVPVKNEYRSLIDNVVQDFYLPLLKEATVYKRAVGFFSSSSLVEISKGIAKMASSGAGKFKSAAGIAAVRLFYCTGSACTFTAAHAPALRLNLCFEQII